MKSIIRYSLLLCLALVCGFFASCADDLLVTPTTDTIGQPLELTVSQATIPATRLELGQDGLTTVWQPRDQLVLVKKDRSSAPIYLNCTLTEPASSATFASESGVPAGDYWVIYNYNENLAYGHHSFSSVDEINEQNKLVLYGELNLTAGTSTASVEMHHLYAQVMVELKNVPDGVTDMTDYTIGMYSSKKGMPIYKQFTTNGLVNAEYGINPNDLNNYNNNSTYFPSDKRWHNIRFGQYNVKGTWIEGYNDPDTGEWMEGHFQSSDGQLSNSALVLPEDLSQEEVFFYVITNEGDNSKCYEIKKAIGKVNLKAGIRYKVVLDLAETDANTTVTTLNGLRDNMGYLAFEISTPEQWRHAAYINGSSEIYGNSGYFCDYIITDNIDFVGEYFFPLNTDNITGNEKTLSNIELDWSNEDNVGLYKTEWIALDGTYYSDCMGIMPPKEYYCNISNLTLESVTFKGKNYVGAFGGYNVQADNCKVIGTSVIAGSGDYVGGIVGWNRLSSDGMVRPLLSEVSVGQNCTVTGVNYVGGIVGAYEQKESWLGQFFSSQQPLNYCVSSATVTATGNYVGGIFGKMGGYNGNSSSSNIEFTMDDYTYTLLKCQNKGSVTGKDYVGGIGGDFALSGYSGSSVDRVVLRQSFSDGKVKGDNYVGGILGRSMASVNTCYSINFIEGTTNVGGIVGTMHNNNRIANCYSLSTLTTGADGVGGGILGDGGMGITVINSYFAGTNPTNCGIIGHSAGGCSVDHCLTTLPSLGTDLILNTSVPMYDIVTASEYNVTSILDKKTVINGDNAYSDNYWPLATYPYYCVKFDCFSADTDAPDYKDDVIN